MTRPEAARQAYVKLIDKVKEGVVNPVRLFELVSLRVFINSISEEEFEKALAKTDKVLSQ